MSDRHRAFLVCLFAFTLARGVVYSTIIPPWQAPDEPGHVEYAVLLAEKLWFLQPGDSSPEVQQRILTSMKEFDFWRYLGREEPAGIPHSFSQDPSLVLSGTQLGDENPLYYLIPALASRLAGMQGILLYLYLLRWFSAALISATVVVAYLSASELFPGDRFMRAAVAAFVVFLPMFVYMGSAANNDALAILLSSLLFWQLIVLFKRGANWRSLSALVVLTSLALLAKKTTSFTAPLLVIALPVYLKGRPTMIPEPYRRAATGCLLISSMLLAVLLGWDSGDAAGWVERPPSPTNTRSDEAARSGDYSLRVTDETGETCPRLVQILPYNSVRTLRGRTVELTAWVRSSDDNDGGMLTIADSEGRTSHAFGATAAWQARSVVRTVPRQATSVRLILSAWECRGHETVDLFFDDVSLRETRDKGPNLVANASAEIPALGVLGHLENLAPHLSLGRLLDVRSYDGDSIRRYSLYALLTFAGFWANFGWLTLPLDPIWYAMLAVLCVVLAVGLGLWANDALTEWKQGKGSLLTWQKRSLFLLTSGLCLILVQTFLPMIGHDWQPQGRYLFPAIVPIATLLSLGWRRIHGRWGSGLSLVAWVTLLFLLHVLCVFRYVIPHYYG
jgi:hypothetical protein